MIDIANYGMQKAIERGRADALVNGEA